MAIDRIKVFAAIRLALFTLLFWGMLIALIVSLGCSSRPLVVTSDRGARFWPPKPTQGFDVSVKSSQIASGLAAQNATLLATNEALGEINASLRESNQFFGDLVKWITGGGLTTILVGGAGFAAWRKYKGGSDAG